MQTHNINELKEAQGLKEAQQALDEGWTLLTVFPAIINNGTTVHASVYVLGRFNENRMLELIEERAAAYTP